MKNNWVNHNFVRGKLLKFGETFNANLIANPSISAELTADSPVSVSSVSSVSVQEGSQAVHVIVLTRLTSSQIEFPFSLTAGSATSGVDYSPTLTFSNGVTINASTLTVPNGVISFTSTIDTLTDALTETPETYTISVGGVSGVGTITDPVAYSGSNYGINQSPMGIYNPMFTQ